jgi:elongation factor G
MTSSWSYTLRLAELSEEQIKAGIRARTLANEIVPVLGGSAFKNKGVQAVLDAVVEFLPSPTEVKAIEGTELDGETPVTRESGDDEPFSALGLQNRNRPLCRHLDVLPRLFRQARIGQRDF